MSDIEDILILKLMKAVENRKNMAKISISTATALQCGM